MGEGRPQLDGADDMSVERLTEEIKKLANLANILVHKLERLRGEGVGVEQELHSTKAMLAVRQEELAKALTEAKPSVGPSPTGTP